jgi:hypothetical protein
MYDYSCRVVWCCHLISCRVVSCRVVWCGGVGMPLHASLCFLSLFLFVLFGRITIVTSYCCRATVAWCSSFSLYLYRYRSFSSTEYPVIVVQTEIPLVPFRIQSNDVMALQCTVLIIKNTHYLWYQVGIAFEYLLGLFTVHTDVRYMDRFDIGDRKRRRHALLPQQVEWLTAEKLVPRTRWLPY